ncbi:MAG: protein kinase [Pseudomonadota bacterium]
MAKPVCPKCGSSDIRLKSTESGVTGSCRNCGAKLRVKPKAQTPGAVPAPAVDTAKDAGSLPGAASNPPDAATSSEPQQSPLKGAINPVPANPATTVYMGGEIDHDAIRKAEAEVPQEWKEGLDVLGLYLVKRELGIGGMGKVWLVHHRGWNIDLAVKAPRLDWVAKHGDAGKDEFKREAETWVNLGLHPHIVSCYYVRDLGGIPRLFAEYVEGGSLETWIRGDAKDEHQEHEKEKKLYEGGQDKALERILDIAVQFAWGLHYAHEQGLVHQDVKPGNVMMTPDGIAKVTDFGLAGARSAADDVSIFGLTAEDFGLGEVRALGCSPQYQSPEQAGAMEQRKSGTESVYITKLGKTTDIWSWGVSILEMFTGGADWGSGSIAGALLENYLDTGPMDERIPPMPDSVVELLKRCFKEQPHERYRTMPAVAERLKEIYRQIVGAEYPREYPKAAADTAGSLNNRAISMLDLGKREEAENLLEKALTVDAHHPQATFNRGLLRWRDAKITDIDFVTAMEEMRKSHENNPDAALLLSRVHDERGDPHQGIEVLESFQKTAGSTEEIRGELENLREHCGEPDRLISSFRMVNNRFYKASERPAISGNGRYAVWSTIARDNGLEVHETCTGRVIGPFTYFYGIFSALFVNDDGSRILAGSADGTVSLWDSQRRTLLHQFEPRSNYGSDVVKSVCLSSDGQHALSGSSCGYASHWNVRTGQLVRVLDDRGADPVLCVSFSRDGRYAVTAGKWRLRVWDVRTGTRVQRVLSPEDGIERSPKVACLSCNGEMLLAGKNDLRLWEVASGRCLRTLKSGSEIYDSDGMYVSFGEVASLGLTDDYRYAWCATEGGRLEVFELSTGRCVRTRRYLGRIKGYQCLPSRDARHAIVEHRDHKEIEIWRLGWVESLQSPLALSRVVTSEKALETDAVYGQCVTSAAESLSRLDFSAAAVNVRRALSLPGCSRRPEAVALWEGLHHRLPRKELRGAWQVRVYRGHIRPVHRVRLSTNGSFVFSCSDRGDIRIWQMEDGVCQDEFTIGRTHPLDACGALPPDPVHTLHLSDDFRYLLYWTPFAEPLVYDVQDRKIIWYWKNNSLGYFVCASQDGKYLVSRAIDEHGFRLRLIHLSTGKLFLSTRDLLRISDRNDDILDAVCLSHDNRYCLRSTKLGGLYLYDLEAGRCMRSLDVIPYGFRPSEKILFAGAGRTALIGGNQWTKGKPGGEQLIVVDTADGRLACTVTGIGGIQSQTQLTLNGHHLVSIDSSGSSGLWDLRSGERVHAFDVPHDQPTSVSISPDGRYVLSGHANGDVILWVLDWELEDRQPADWDDGAADYLQVFLDQHVPYAGEIPTDREPTEEEITLALTRRGKPVWTEDDFKRLLDTLGCVGYGWLRPEGVKKQLEAMARDMPEATP